MRLIFAFLMLILSWNTHAQEERLEGFANYKFGMTIEQTKAVRLDAVETPCSSKLALKCFEFYTIIYGEKASIRPQIYRSTEQLEAVTVTFPIELSRCDALAEKIALQLLDKYGDTFTKDKQNFTHWYFSGGGSVTFTWICIPGAELGAVIVSYRNRESL